MAKLAQGVGGLWIALCVVLWLYIGFFTPEPDIGAGAFNWTLPRLLADSRFGLTFVPILLAIPGASLWAWGRKRQAGNRS